MAAETSGQLYESKVIAQLFGVSVRRIQQLTQDGVLETVHISGQRNKYDLIPTIQAYIKYLSDKAYGREAKLGNRTEGKEAASGNCPQGIADRASPTPHRHCKRQIYQHRGSAGGLYEVLCSPQALLLRPSEPGRWHDRLTNLPVESRELEKDLNKEINDILRTFVLAATVKDGDGG